MLKHRKTENPMGESQKQALRVSFVSEKPALQAVKDLAKPLIRKKIAQTTPTHHEHEPKWEILVYPTRPLEPMNNDPSEKSRSKFRLMLTAMKQSSARSLLRARCLVPAVVFTLFLVWCATAIAQNGII